MRGEVARIAHRTDLLVMKVTNFGKNAESVGRQGKCDCLAKRSKKPSVWFVPNMCNITLKPNKIEGCIKTARAHLPKITLQLVQIENMNEVPTNL